MTFLRARIVAPLLATFAIGSGILHCSNDRVGFNDDAADSGNTSSTSSSSGTGSSSGSSGSFGEAGLTDGPGDGVCTEDIDVVLVLDVSSSMGFVLTKLESEIEKVVTASNALKDGAHFGLVIYADNGALVTTGDLEGGKVHTQAASLKSAFANARNVYTNDNRNPGDGPSGPDTQNPICEENSLDALETAATAFPWRANAAHVVIVATDDTFIEKPDNYGDRDNDGKTDKTNFPKEGDYPAKFTLDETITALKSKNARVFSFSRNKTSLLGGCGTGRRNEGQDVITWGWSKPYKGKAPIPDQTGGKNFDLAAVQSGSLSLADTINEVVLESHCAGPPK